MPLADPVMRNERASGDMSGCYPVGMPLTARDVGFTVLRELDEPRHEANANRRLARIRAVAPDFKKDFVRGAALAVRTFPTSYAPYPVSYAFSRACALPWPYLVFQNRAVLVQFMQGGQPRTLLMNPTIPARAQRTPFFARLSAGLPFADTIRDRLLVSPPIPEQLTSAGVRVEDIDYVAFDHQHTQDLRPYLGTPDMPKLYPRAKFLVQRTEWEASLDLHPLQREWWVGDNAAGVRDDDVVLLDGDVQLGEGVALLATPGHTWGNQSLYFRTAARGCFTVSENGVCMDAYSPAASRIPGLARRAAQTGEEVVMNGNTLENSLDQYNSMIKEKLLADPYPPDSRFVQHFASSELTHTVVAPGLRPTHAIVAVNEGELVAARQPLRAVG
jgi:hypothetical protein